MFYYERRNQAQACQKCKPAKPCRDCRKKAYAEEKEREQAQSK